MKLLSYTSVAILIFIISIAILYSETTLDSDFFIKQLKDTHPIDRDTAASSLMNTQISFTAEVKSTDEKSRYNRRFRIIAVDYNSSQSSMKIKYYIFINNRNVWSEMDEGEIYLFKGIITAYTPLNTERDSYIFDVLFSSVEIVVE